MAEGRMASGARDRLAGKRIVFKADSGDRWSGDAGVLVPEKATNVEVEVEYEKGPYGELKKEWEQKNELLKATEALGKFSTEGGQELITIFGAEKVAAALDEVLKGPINEQTGLRGPIDERTGLYMLVRTLEPNRDKRSALYAKMLKTVDDESRAYGREYAQKRTPAEREKYRALRGGEYAPDANVAMSRKMRIREYQLYDKAAFTPLVGPLVAAMERAMSGTAESPKYAIQMLRGHFTPDSFVKGIENMGGSLSDLVSLRLERVDRMEKALESARARHIKKLHAETSRREAEIRAPYQKKTEELFEDLDRLSANESALTTPEAKALVQRITEHFEGLALELQAKFESELTKELGEDEEMIRKLEGFDVFKDE